MIILGPVLSESSEIKKFVTLIEIYENEYHMNIYLLYHYI